MNHDLFFIIFNLAHQTSFIDSFIVFCAKYLQYFALAFLLIYLAYHYVGEFAPEKPFFVIRTKIKEILLVFVPAVFSWVAAELIKAIVHAPRPFIVFKDTIQPLFIHGGMDSFPSGHAMFFGALAMSVFFVHKELGKFFFLIAFIIGLARVASGVHFPIDILFGYIFGIAVSFIFHRIFLKKYS